ncbi:MAG: hypothetical protein KIG72_00440 [Bradymonadales bacterium]|nr:hypothetical protein [Bradymonadales bacterium]
MKLDKRFILAASLVLGLGLGFQACSDDDDSSDEAKTECKVNTDCKDKAKPVCTAGKCVAETPTDTNACKDKTEGADCGEGKTCQKGADDKLECKAKTTGGDTTKECYKSINCSTDKPICSEGKCIAAADAKACTKTEECGADQFCKDGKCEDKAKPATCRNKALDDKEICDIDKSGNAIFATGKEITCQQFFDMNPDNYPAGTVAKDGGKPGCSDDCLAYKKGTCEVANSTCKDGNWDEGEKCEIIDNKTMVKDGENIREATCNDYKKDSGMTGMPGCSKDCKGFSKGTCGEEGGDQPAPTAINGVKSCKVVELSFVTADGDNKNKIMGKVTVVTENAETTVKGAVLCEKADADTKYGSMISAGKDLVADAVDGVVTSYTKAYTAADNGAYKCVVVVQDASVEGLKTEKAVICSDTGAIVDGSNQGGTKVADIPNAKDITITVQ